jgi:hypothetical protein
VKSGAANQKGRGKSYRSAEVTDEVVAILTGPNVPRTKRVRHECDMSELTTR